MVKNPNPIYVFLYSKDELTKSFDSIVLSKTHFEIWVLAKCPKFQIAILK